VLLAEDNPVNRRIATETLRKLGCQVTPAANGAEAVRLWETGRHPLVLMDLNMPEVDGHEATLRLRALEQAAPAARRCLVVALTACAMEGDREQCLANGMDGYITKPFRAAQLRQTLLELDTARRGEMKIDRFAPGVSET
jgi:CheY-like chemotaxis protein